MNLLLMLLFSTISFYLLLDFHVKAGTRFSLRDKRLFEISEVEITRVNCIQTVGASTLYIPLCIEYRKKIPNISLFASSYLAKITLIGSVVPKMFEPLNFNYMNENTVRFTNNLPKFVT